MPELNLDAQGNPLPPLLEAMELPDFEQRYVVGHGASATRAQIFSKYQRYLRDFRTMTGVGFKQWIDGSFTTSKRDPGDIDVVSFIEYSTAIDAQAVALRQFQTVGGSLDTYQVDGFLVQVYAPDDPRYAVTQHSMMYWASWFGFDRQGNEKTVVELSVS